MLKRLKALIRSPKSKAEDDSGSVALPPAYVNASGAVAFDLAASLVDANGFPVVDWEAVHRWIESVPGDPAKAQAWSSCERAWLEHLRAALGPHYRVRSQGPAILVSTLPRHIADATLAYVNTTVQRIVRLLQGIAARPEWGNDILVVFDEDDSYYRYVSHSTRRPVSSLPAAGCMSTGAAGTSSP